MVVARTWVRLYQAMDNSFITLNDTLKDACGARALQVRGINISSIPYVISVQEKCSMRHQVISMKELELILVEKRDWLTFRFVGHLDDRSSFLSKGRKVCLRLGCQSAPLYFPTLFPNAVSLQAFFVVWRLALECLDPISSPLSHCELCYVGVVLLCLSLIHPKLVQIVLWVT